MNVFEPTVIVPVRSIPVFASTENCTVSGPLPLDPAVTWIHGSAVVAVQVQPATVVTEKEPVPPPDATSCDDGEMSIVQPLACVAVNVCPPAVMVAERDGPVLDAAVKFTVPLPDPLAPPVICNQPSLDEADHAHEAGAVIEKLPDPPLASKL